jgi:hypothetical protein
MITLDGIIQALGEPEEDMSGVLNLMSFLQ